MSARHLQVDLKPPLLDMPATDPPRVVRLSPVVHRRCVRLTRLGGLVRPRNLLVPGSGIERRPLIRRLANRQRGQTTRRLADLSVVFFTARRGRDDAAADHSLSRVTISRRR